VVCLRNNWSQWDSGKEISAATLQHVNNILCRGSGGMSPENFCFLILNLELIIYNSLTCVNTIISKQLHVIMGTYIFLVYRSRKFDYILAVSTHIMLQMFARTRKFKGQAKSWLTLNQAIPYVKDTFIDLNYMLPRIVFLCDIKK